MFITTVDELRSSVEEFDSAGHEDKKNMVGTGYKYFVHIKEGNTHKFGLSKFCAFKGITPDKYIRRPKLRETTNGTITQKHIRKITRKEWLPLSKQAPEIQKAFKKWIKDFLDNPNLERVKIISI